MRRKLVCLAACLAPCLMIFAGAHAQAAETADAPALLAKSCDTCHTQVFGKPESVYTRSNRRVASKQVLLDQVKLWNSSAGAKWGDGEIEAVARHLDQTYYKLP